MKNIRKTVLGLLFCFAMITGIFTSLGQKVKAAETGSVETVGDINGDNEINAKDVTMLRRYLAKGWGVTVDEADADINGDGEVNAKDVTMLRRYLAKGWGVELPLKSKNNNLAPGEGWQVGSDAGTPYRSTNVGSNNYTIWTSTIKSYMYEEDGFFVRAEAEPSKGMVHIEKYTKEFKLAASKDVLYGSQYIWGGLYCGKNENYLNP